MLIKLSGTITANDFVEFCDINHLKPPVSGDEYVEIDDAVPVIVLAKFAADHGHFLASTQLGNIELKQIKDDPHLSAAMNELNGAPVNFAEFSCYANQEAKEAAKRDRS